MRTVTKLRTSTRSFEPLPLGQFLLQQGLITQEALQSALKLQHRTGDRIGHILAAEGHISPFQLHKAIAAYDGLPFINLRETLADPQFLNADQIDDYLSLLAIPLRKEAGRIVIATSNPTDDVRNWAAQHFSAYTLAIASPLDIHWHINRHFADVLNAHSREHLWRNSPEQSARSVFSRSQKRQLTVLLMLGALATALFPATVAIACLIVVQVFYFFTIVLKCQLFALGNGHRPETQFISDQVDSALPLYTLLIPLHDEAASVPRLIAALDALDYPKSRLDIKLIVESNDHSTIDAIKAARPHGGYEIVYVPYSLPQTKPKACNYALRFARGKYVTIYDAEDQPDPLQLKKAVHRFANLPGNVACLQARLNYYNRNQSLLSRLFAIEYAMWFDYMLPGLRAMGIPIPLGGTSNHLRLDLLKELGEWDPYNVTEDADLGVRIALRHYETELLDSLTLEEAPTRLRPWIYQRTRWIRGYMQTWLVHMRNPQQLAKQLNSQAFWGFQFFIGGPCLVFLSAPILWIVSGLWFAGVFTADMPKFSPWISGLAIGNLVFGLAVHLVFAGVILRRYRWGGMGKAVCAFPFYWLLHSVASVRALWKLLTDPHRWEKTPHGASDA